MNEYDTDTVIWSERQADLLRRRAMGELVNEALLDWSNIAEEIGSLGKSLARELGSRVAAILIHLMKLAASPASEPRVGWCETIREQRDEIERVLQEAPSLRQTVPAVVSYEMGRARKRVRAALADQDEQPRVDIDSLTYTEDQVLSDWFPDRLQL